MRGGEGRRKWNEEGIEGNAFVGIRCTRLPPKADACAHFFKCRGKRRPMENQDGAIEEHRMVELIDVSSLVIEVHQLWRATTSQYPKPVNQNL